MSFQTTTSPWRKLNATLCVGGMVGHDSPITDGAIPPTIDGFGRPAKLKDWSSKSFRNS